MTTEETRLTRLEEQRINMASDIKDLKEDLKEFKTETKHNFEKIQENFGELRIQIAKWAGGIAVAVTVAQFVIGKLLANL
jgi:chromosome segregation ATPase